MAKLHPTIGCCGIDCGLCPRFYTEGKSRCPGCGGKDFELKHPPCSFKNCCDVKHGHEVCAQCAEFPCKKYEDRQKIERDSFVTHKRMFANHDTIRKAGLDAFLSAQKERVTILRNMLADYDDGRSKSFLCMSAALLSVEGLNAALAKATNAQELKAELNAQAAEEGIELAASRKAYR